MKVILAVVNDLFFISKILVAANNLGYKIYFAKNHEEFINGLKLNPNLIIVDINLQSFDVIKMVQNTRIGINASIIGYASHVQTNLMKTAEQSGFDKVFPKSLFSQKLEFILKTMAK